MSTIYGNPLLLGGGGNKQVLKWNDKFTKITSFTSATTRVSITVKALCYYDGYWYGVGNDSVGDLYKLYGTTTSSTLYASRLASSRAYPATGITCDGTNVWICTSSGAYNNRTILHQTINNFRSSNTAYNYYTLTGVSSIAFNDICQINDATIGSCIFATGAADNNGIAWMVPSNLSNTYWRKISNTSSDGFVSCCNWNENAIFVAKNGYICKYVGDNTTYSGQTLTCLQGAKMVRAMNGNLFIVCVRDKGTYLYWFKSGADITSSQPTGHIKITDEALTIVGMAYAGGLYIVVGIDSSGTIKALQSDSMFSTSIYGQSIPLISGYTPRSMVTDGTTICILADNGGQVSNAICKIE